MTVTPRKNGKENTEKEIVIIHLSDLHFGRDLWPEGAGLVKHALWKKDKSWDTVKKKSPEVTDSKFVEEFGKTINTIVSPKNRFQKKDGKKNLPYLVVTGDFVICGQDKDEHELAFDALRQLCKKSRIPVSNVVIVPGNHDVSRMPNALPQDRMQNHKNAVAKFYGRGHAYYDARGELVSQRYSLIKPGSAFPWAKNDSPVRFIPLQTQYISETNKVTGYGFLEKELLMEQLVASGVCKKKENDKKGGADFSTCNNKNCLQIALMHHNPFPVPTTKEWKPPMEDRPDNCLVNGANVLNKLIEHRVSLVLHGHRHQTNVIKLTSDSKQDCLVVGCHTAGEAEQQDGTVGFCVYRIYKAAKSCHVRVEEYEYNIKEGSWCNERTTEHIVRTEGYNAPFLSFNDGYLKLQESLLNRKVSQHIMFHVFSVPDFWEGIVKWAQTFDSVLEGDMKDAKERKFLNKNDYKKLKHVLFSSSRKDEGKRIRRREVSYLIELVRCHMDSSLYTLHKCLYFRKEREVKDKLKWMVDSILAARTLKNYTLSWLPERLNNNSGVDSSLIEARILKDKADYLLGFYNEENKAMPTVVSVADYKRGYKKDQDDFMAASSVASLARKTIRPIAKYLEESFPLYKDGVVYLGNIEEMLREVSPASITLWKQLEAQLTNAFGEHQLKTEVSNGWRARRGGFKNWLRFVLCRTHNACPMTGPNKQTKVCAAPKCKHSEELIPWRSR